MTQITSKLFLEPGSFGARPDYGSGLNLPIAGGQYLNANNVRKAAPNIVIALTASATNYIVVSAGGVISSNTTGFTTGSAPLYKVTTNATVITDIEDYRATGRSAVFAIVIPVADLRLPAGGPITASEAAGGFNFSLSAHVYKAQAEITDNETEASVALAQVILPANYVAGSPITVRLICTIVKTGSAVDNGSTIDLSVYKQAAGAVGSDLCETAAQTFAAVDTFYSKDFVVTPTGLVAGDTLNLEITSNIVDSEAGAGTLRFNMEPVKVLIDVAA